jgi:hypothetical protein
MLFALGAMAVKPNKEWMGAALERAYKLFWWVRGGWGGWRAFLPLLLLLGACVVFCGTMLAVGTHAINLVSHSPPFHYTTITTRSRFDTLDLVGVISGVAAMGYSPNQRWLDAYAAAVAGRADHISSRHLEVIATALKRIGYTSTKPQAWIAM